MVEKVDPRELETDVLIDRWLGRWLEIDGYHPDYKIEVIRRAWHEAQECDRVLYLSDLLKYAYKK